MAEATKDTPPILSRLSPPRGAVRRKKRKGRGPGSGLGKTAGKGQKGQKARHPGNFGRVGFEGGQMPLMRRLPKVGFRNEFARRVAEVNLRDLARFEAGSIVGPEELRAAGLVKGRYEAIKVLGSGEIAVALTVRAHGFSKGARAKIEQAGGKAEVLGA